MLDAKDTAGETAIAYTDQFFEAAVKKIEKTFGKGFARENPALVQAYVHSCALNLGSFIHSAVALQASGELDEMLDELRDEDAS
jgi:hypothetical protein